MSDDDLLQTVRTQFTDVRLDARVEDVMARGRQLRRRRTWPALGAGTGAVTAVVALTFGLATSGVGPGSTHVVLDAWSVVSKPDGTVSVTIRDQRESGQDRARLRKALRQAGVPAVVQTALPGGCHTVSSPQPIQVSRHRGAITAIIELGRLPKRAQLVVVVPAVVVTYKSASGGRTEVRIPPPAVASRHGSQAPLPEVVMLGTAVCEPSKAPGR